MPDLSVLLSTAALPEKTVAVCLRGDLIGQIEDLERQLRDLHTSAVTLADRGQAQQVATSIEKLREQMQASTVVFRFRGLGRQAWSDLMLAHPPREGDDGDERVGYNLQTFFPALVRATLCEPEVDGEQWERLELVLSSQQYDELIDAALAVSRRTVDVPFSFAASATLQRSSAT